MLSKNTKVETIKLNICTNVENTTQYKINMTWYIIIKTAWQYVIVLMRTEAENDETLLIPNFIKLTKTRQHNEEYDMVKLQVKTDNLL